MWIKQHLAWFLIVLISINSFGAVVSDNDGAAFVSKAEFDSLKNEFQTGINQFMGGLDQKINNAINAYVSGIKQDSERRANVIGSGQWYAVNTGYTAGSSDYTWRYKYGSPRFDIRWSFVGPMTTFYDRYTQWQADHSVVVQSFKIPMPEYATASHAQHKLCVQNVNETQRTAEWVGIAYGAHDEVFCINPGYNNSTAQALWDYTWTEAWYGPWRPNNAGNIPSYGDGWLDRNVDYGILGEADGRIQVEFLLRATYLKQHWGAIKQKNIILLDSKPYLNFSQYPKSRNWKFYRSGSDATTSCEKLWTTLTRKAEPMPNEYRNCFGSIGVWENRSWKASDSVPTCWTDDVVLSLMSNFPSRGAASDGEPVYGNPGVANYLHFNWPCVGFEDNYITNWNQLYTKSFDNVVSDKDLNAVRSRFLLDDDGVYHAGIVNGVPIIKSPKKGTVVEFELELKDPIIDIATGSETYSIKDSYVWIAESPFTGWPNDNTDCLTLSCDDGSAVSTTDADYRRGIKIPVSSHGKCKIKCTTKTNNQYLWIKWTCNGKSGGGIITLPDQCKLTIPG